LEGLIWGIDQDWRNTALGGEGASNRTKNELKAKSSFQKKKKKKAVQPLILEKWRYQKMRQKRN